MSEGAHVQRRTALDAELERVVVSVQSFQLPG